MKFQIRDLMLGTAIVAVVIFLGLSIVAPLVRLINHHEVNRQRILNDLDHKKIKAAALQLLADGVHGGIEPDNVPQAIAETEPLYVLALESSVRIDYGAGHHHYGLIVIEDGSAPADGIKLIEGVYFFEFDP